MPGYSVTKGGNGPFVGSVFQDETLERIQQWRNNHRQENSIRNIKIILQFPDQQPQYHFIGRIDLVSNSPNAGHAGVPVPHFQIGFSKVEYGNGSLSKDIYKFPVGLNEDQTRDIMLYGLNNVGYQLCTELKYRWKKMDEGPSTVIPGSVSKSMNKEQWGDKWKKATCAWKVV